MTNEAQFLSPELVDAIADAVERYKVEPAPMVCPRCGRKWKAFVLCLTGGTYCYDLRTGQFRLDETCDECWEAAEEGASR